MKIAPGHNLLVKGHNIISSMKLKMRIDSSKAGLEGVHSNGSHLDFAPLSLSIKLTIYSVLRDLNRLLSINNHASNNFPFWNSRSACLLISSLAMKNYKTEIPKFMTIFNLWILTKINLSTFIVNSNMTEAGMYVLDFSGNKFG